ncbi:MAG: hypothetical protein ABIV43_01325 [Candidatus Saccharimonadales bacterium]
MELHHTAVKEEKGFSAVEVLLCLIIVILIGFIGFFVYNTQKSTDKLNQAATTSTPAVKQTDKSPKATTDSTNYLTITEWGVRFAVTGDSEPTYAFHARGSMSADGGFSYGNDTVDIGSKKYNNLVNSDGNQCGTIDDNTGKKVSAPNTRRMIQIASSPAGTEESATAGGSVTLGATKYTYFTASRYRPGCSQLANGDTDQNIFNQDSAITDLLIKDASTLSLAKAR